VAIINESARIQCLPNSLNATGWQLKRQLGLDEPLDLPRFVVVPDRRFHAQ